MAVWRRPGFLRQINPGVPSDVTVFLRVLASTGRSGFRLVRLCASFPPSLLRYYCQADIVRGALAKLTRYDRVTVHQGMIQRGSPAYFICKWGL
jgi:hypothetical protein